LSFSSYTKKAAKNGNAVDRVGLTVKSARNVARLGVEENLNKRGKHVLFSTAGISLHFKKIN
jgi:hypothetical protein